MAIESLAGKHYFTLTPNGDLVLPPILWKDLEDFLRYSNEEANTGYSNISISNYNPQFINVSKDDYTYVYYYGSGYLDHIVDHNGRITRFDFDFSKMSFIVAYIALDDQHEFKIACTNQSSYGIKIVDEVACDIIDRQSGNLLNPLVTGYYYGTNDILSKDALINGVAVNLHYYADESSNEFPGFEDRFALYDFRNDLYHIIGNFEDNTGLTIDELNEYLRYASLTSVFEKNDAKINREMVRNLDTGEVTFPNTRKHTSAKLLEKLNGARWVLKM